MPDLEDWPSIKNPTEFFEYLPDWTLKIFLKLHFQTHIFLPTVCKLFSVSCDLCWWMHWMQICIFFQCWHNLDISTWLALDHDKHHGWSHQFCHYFVHLWFCKDCQNELVTNSDSLIAKIIEWFPWWRVFVRILLLLLKTN